jgi:hypothetical protein
MEPLIRRFPVVVSRRTVMAFLVACAALGLAAELACFVRPDMAFLLYAAGRVLDGARLYRDVVEINPPMIIALNLPPVLLGRALGVNDVLVYRVLTVAGMAGGLWLIARLSRRLAPRDEVLSGGLLILSGFVLLLLPGVDFGQREHLLAALVLPYVVACMARAVSRPVSPAMGVVVGALAGAGFALKPQFVVLWPVMEAYFGLRSRPRGPRGSAESGAIAGVLLLYGLAIVLVTPDYVPMVRRLGHSYFEYMRLPFIEVALTAAGLPLCLTGALAFAALFRRLRHVEGAWILLLSMAASFLAGVLQGKGLPYHFYPATAFAILLLGYIILDLVRPLVTTIERLYAAVVTASLATAFLVASGWAVTRILGRDPIDQRNRRIVLDLRDAIRRQVEHGSLLILSNNLGSVFPLVRVSGLDWASRFPHFWILAAEYQDQLVRAGPIRYRSRTEMGPAERYLNDAMYEDLLRWRPDLILVLRPAADRPPNLFRRLNYIGYFSRDPRTAALLGGYSFVEVSSEYEVYRRTGSGVTSGHPPAVEAGTQDVLRNDARGARALINDPGFLAAALVFVLTLLSALAFERSRPGSAQRAAGA